MPIAGVYAGTYVVCEEHVAVGVHDSCQRDGCAVVPVVLTWGDGRREAYMPPVQGTEVYPCDLEDVPHTDAGPAAVGDNAVVPEDALDLLHLVHLLPPIPGTLRTIHRRLSVRET